MQELELKNYLAHVTRRLGQALLHQDDYAGPRVRSQESLVVNVEIGDMKAVRRVSRRVRSPRSSRQRNCHGPRSYLAQPKL